ncbi:HET-domain-containing protein [Trichodelitschia bisporula]|uniref:HET-domain-containing protein n=1 Tax=Trichodelitschia bisporula TaxID=703511 RepID=A0A6G1HKN7_9PEZI|nr:HET-domain-containing protein [Trichodelitschia bisporula]
MPFAGYAMVGKNGLFEVPPHRLGLVEEIRTSTCAFCRPVWASFVNQTSTLVPPDIFNGRKVSIELESIACSAHSPLGTYDSAAEPFVVRLHLSLSPTGIWNTSADALHRPRNPDVRAAIHRLGDQAGRPVRPVPDLQLSSNAFVRRLIDVDRECLVTLDHRTQPPFVVLRYVWGRQPFATLTRATLAAFHVPGALPATRTVGDAMALCRTLGEKFLWVDALCICQDAVEEKMEDIGWMDFVYGCAKLTIVTAHSDGASAGLSGITSRPQVQHVVDVQGMRLANRLQSTAELIDAAFWKTRGWTFQERLLSRRLLFFTAHQVFFRCHEMECTEEGSDPPAPTAPQPHVLYPIPTYEFNTDIDDFQVYAQIATRFSKRNLSFEGDVMNALLGIFSALNPTVLGPTSFNVPLRMLDLAVLWSPLGPLRRRAVGPTIRLSTTVGTLYVSREHVDRRTDPALSVSIYPNTSPCGSTHFAYHLVLESEGKRCGRVVVDGATFGDLKAGEYDFVELSRTTLAHGEEDTAWDAHLEAYVGEPGAPACLVNVLMVQWEGNVAQRMGVGKVHVHAWERVKQAREVVLG